MSHVLTTTPAHDGFSMPGEYEPQDQVWLIWPERPDSWRDGGKPAQIAYTAVAEAIADFTPVTMCVSQAQYRNARVHLSPRIRVVEMSNDDSWVRDCGPSFIRNSQGIVRAVDWDYNAWGGLVDGLYFPWDLDDQIPSKICEIERINRYRTPGFVLEGGSFQVDGAGTLCTTKMCLLSAGRNPHLTQEEIEETLKEYLGVTHIVWLEDGLDPEETNGHVDDVMHFIGPAEAVCIYPETGSEPFADVAIKCYEELVAATGADGTPLTVHKLCLPQKGCRLQEDFAIDPCETTFPRVPGTQCTASYANFLMTNDGVIVPQYDDPHDALALEQLKSVFPYKTVVGVPTREIVYGGGNIHCITQQQPSSLIKEAL